MRSIPMLNNIVQKFIREYMYKEVDIEEEKYLTDKWMIDYDYNLPL